MNRAPPGSGQSLVMTCQVICCICVGRNGASYCHVVAALHGVVFGRLLLWPPDGSTVYYGEIT
jgi:hypothetical protein